MLLRLYIKIMQDHVITTYPASKSKTHKIIYYGELLQVSFYWGNGNVPSVTDTVTCHKNINGQKHICLCFLLI